MFKSIVSDNWQYLELFNIIVLYKSYIYLTYVYEKDLA